MADNEVERYESEKATVTWNRKLCIHTGECGRAKGELFVGGRDPWCDPAKADEAGIEDVIERCPTGALAVSFVDKGMIETPTAENTVHVVYNGPYYFRGELEIEGAPDNAPGLAFRATICRCGMSGNLPFCDNSHEKQGFRDYGAVGETKDAAEGEGGPLKVSFAENGPITVSGNFSIVAATGRKDWHGRKATLCRCGHSANKPFCDGSHAKEGWKSA